MTIEKELKNLLIDKGFELKKTKKSSLWTLDHRVHSVVNFYNNGTVSFGFLEKYMRDKVAAELGTILNVKVSDKKDLYRNVLSQLPFYKSIEKNITFSSGEKGGDSVHISENVGMDVFNEIVKFIVSDSENTVPGIKIAFIGAGKVGCSLGKHLSLHGLDIVGYYSRSSASSREAADFTASQELSLPDVLTGAELIFITVPDGQIAAAAEEIARQARHENIDISGKIFCHCSGSFSAEVLHVLSEMGAYICSLHPMLAFADKFTSYEKLPEAFFSLEGDPETRDIVQEVISACGNTTTIIDGAKKAEYHLAAVISSNFVLALINQSMELLADCGFSPEDSGKALAPLIQNNINNILSRGPRESLTGPVERADIKTVEKHLAVLQGNRRKLYTLLSRELVTLAESRQGNNKDYSPLLSLLDENI
jgi:predicted short-subunit dehydrogenase-like oxidoreductase (DUF2520 family)